MNGVKNGGREKEEEELGLSVHSPCKEQTQVEVELTLLEALEIYPLVKLQGSLLVFLTLAGLAALVVTGVHRHFVLFGLTEYLRRSLNQQFSGSDVLQLLDRFYNLEMMKSDDEEMEILNREEDFCLPSSYFMKQESRTRKSA